MTWLVTGGCGFVGCNVAARLMGEGEDVVVADDLSRHGSEANLAWLRERGAVRFERVETQDAGQVDALVAAVRPAAIIHLAGQVAMTTSMANPRRDFETNVVGTFNVLEAVRKHVSEAAVVYASSNKVYGALAGVELREAATRYEAPAFPGGVAEDAPLDFRTPYGCSKGAADQYMLDYARMFGLHTVVFRHSTIYGGRQFATFDQGWVGWFCRQALETRADPGRAPFTIAGDGKQVRDLLFADDAVDAYLAAVRHVDRARGEAFNIGGGMANSSSLLELFAQLEALTGTTLRYERGPWRTEDQRYFVADNGKAARLLGWRPKVSKPEGVARALEWAAQSPRS